MNILITGANGFIGKNAVKHFRQKGYNVYTATSDTLNLFNAHQVDDFFENIAIDYVLHTAIKVRVPNLIEDEIFTNLKKNSLDKAYQSIIMDFRNI